MDVIGFSFAWRDLCFLFLELSRYWLVLSEVNLIEFRLRFRTFGRAIDELNPDEIKQVMEFLLYYKQRCMDVIFKKTQSSFGSLQLLYLVTRKPSCSRCLEHEKSKYYKPTHVYKQFYLAT